MPVVVILSTTRRDEFADRTAAFQEGLKQAGYTDGQNVVIERRSAEGQYDQLSALVADLVRRQVALIVGNTPSALATKAATTTVPIIFVTGGDPVRDGLVASVSRPGSNVTGVSFMTAELGAKQLGLLRELRPGVARVAVLVDPRWPLTDVLVSELRAAASAMGQQIDVLYVSSDREIEAAFTMLVQRGGLVRCTRASGRF
jgi:putative ABC transport system substrate-binding protein